MSKAKICECAICGEEDLRKNLNDLDDVLVCNYCHQVGDCIITEEEFREAVITRAKEIYPDKRICTDFLKEGFEDGLIKGGTETLAKIEETANTIAFDSAWWNGDFPG